jgi:hypothetical protein
LTIVQGSLAYNKDVVFFYENQPCKIRYSKGRPYEY